jgi:beta-glucanase (GH16 family)
VASDGGIFSFGDATFFGSTGALSLNKPIVGMASTADGRGYWLVASDGGIFSFGDATFFGSLGGSGASVIGMMMHSDSAGYLEVEANGAAVNFSPAPTSPTDPAVPMPTPTTTTTTAPPATTKAPTTTTTTQPPTTTTTTTTTSPPTNPAGSGSNCGGTPIYKSDGSQWQCTFDDEFNGTSLDTTKWVIQQTANSAYTTGSGAGTACYVNSPNNVSVSGGYLNLTVRQEAAPFTCQDGPYSFTTNYTSGMVSTSGLFSQAYGLFEVRAKLPSSAIQGLQETFWLWPNSSSKYGAWPDSGEIDFAEFYSQFPALDIPYIHYNAAGNDPNVTAYNCSITPGAFSTFGLEWAPGSLTILDNGQTCLVDHTDPASPLTGGQPFDQPFFIALTQALGINTDAFVSGTTPLPATTQVDWVRAWQ